MKSIEAQLLRWRRTKIVLGSAAAVLAVLGGLVFVFLTFWFSYAIIWFGMYGVSAVSELIWNKKLYLSHEFRLLFSGIWVVLLFVYYFRSDRQYWSDYEMADYNLPKGKTLTSFGLFGGLGLLLAYPGTSSKLIVDIFLTGPRLVIGAFKLLREARVLLRMDLPECAKLIELLLQRRTPVSYEELREAGWEPWLPQLRHIDGLRFLENGVTLASDWRIELTGTEAWRATR